MIGQMTAMAWTWLAGCVGHLALALLALFRGARTPVGLPLVLLCLDVFGWNLADLAWEISKQPAWHWLDLTLSPFSPAFALHVGLAFTGRARAWRRVIVGSYVVFGSLSVAAALSFVVAAVRPWAGGPAWSGAFVAAELVAMAIAMGAIATHLRNTSDHDEAMRARLILVAFAIGVCAGTSELLTNVWPSVPPFGHVGMLAATLVVAIVVLRLRLFGRELSKSVALYAIVLAAAGVVAWGALLLWLPRSFGVTLLGAALVTLALAAAVREVTQATSARRERTARLAFLGRMSDQLAHDLKNPLAAMKGALQFLREERARGASLAEQDEMLDLMLEQVERMRRGVDRYRTYGRVEPHAKPEALNDVVRRALALGSFGADGVTVETTLADDLPAAVIDPDLVSFALENLVRNALEALPGGGVVRVSTARTRGGAVAVDVADDGAGMDPRDAERAFDDFFTTKAGGSGLGLAFVRRVAEAHGGRVTVSTALGRGTVVRMELPSAGEAR
jgi:signal transduction histidine kinase